MSEFLGYVNSNSLALTNIFALKEHLEELVHGWIPSGNTFIKYRDHWSGKGSKKGTLPFSKRNSHNSADKPKSFKRRRYCR